MRAILILAMLGAAPAAAQDRPLSPPRTWYGEVRAAAQGCDDAALRLPPFHNIDYDRDARRQLAAMLGIDPARCPGVAAAAAAMIRERLGAPERFDVDLDLLAFARRGSALGQGASSDPAATDLYGRMLWLFADHPPELPHWAAAERESWLTRPEAIEMLRRRNDEPRLRTRRSLELEGELRLRRGAPFYDPVRAGALLEDSSLFFNLENRLRVSRLFIEGDHLPADYPRAAAPFLMVASMQGEIAADYQRELLRIGRLAAAAARTSAERAAALRILYAAALDGRFGSRADVAAMRRRIGRAPDRPLAPADTARIADVMASPLRWAMPYRRDGEPLERPPIVLRALIGPDGRVALALVARSSGSAERDRAALGAWAEHGGLADLSATAGGRLVWAELPPIDPLPD